jgi:hydrogenase nickel incorporation protein HypA/HybF
MHETAIAVEIAKIVMAVGQQNRVKKVNKVHIQAGQLRGIVPEQLQLSWNFVTRGTIADNSDLYVETIPIEGLCQACNKTFLVKNYEFKCPYCGGDQVDTIKGMELLVKNLDLDF